MKENFLGDIWVWGLREKKRFFKGFYFQELVFIGRFGFVIESDKGSNLMSLL